MSLKGNASKDLLEEFYYDLETENLIRKKQEFYNTELFEGRNDRTLASIVYDVLFTGTTFENNKGSYGAAIYASNTPLTLTSCIFRNNVASQEGGAVYFTSSVTDTASVLKMVTNLFR